MEQMDRRVLVVDDDPAMLKLLSKYLVAGQYEVLTATTGRQALDILHREGPPLVLSDWTMPGMDGLELCRAIRASEAIGFVFVVIMTAQSDKQCVVDALNAGANDFLTKPFHHQEMLARLNAGMRVIELEADLMRERRELHKINAELSILNRKLELMATTDELTGLANRREAMRRLRNCWDISVRDDQPLSCIMLDLDFFKRCNDTYGHDVGDLILKETAQHLQSQSRTGDLACRLGGEEFLILCPAVDQDRAMRVAEQFRRAVEAHVIRTGDLGLKVTLSAGVSDRQEFVQNAEELLRNADQALYEAKRTGRNKVVGFGDASHKPVGSAEPAMPIA
jgi:two-component system, cell cycle response regulator